MDLATRDFVNLRTPYILTKQQMMKKSTTLKKTLTDLDFALSQVPEYRRDNEFTIADFMEKKGVTESVSRRLLDTMVKEKKLVFRKGLHDGRHSRLYSKA